MKKFLSLIILILVSSSVIAQSDWSLVWKLDTLPFDPMKTDTLKQDSEMAIVKAGFDTDQDGWGEFLCAWTDLDSNYTLMYEATADNTYELVWYWLHPVPANTFAGITVGHIDDNDKVDLILSLPSVVSDDSPPRVWVFEWNGVVGENKYGNYGSGEMEPTNYWDYDVPSGTDFRPYSLIVEDIDHDGVNELITGVRQSESGSVRQVIVASVQGQLSGFGSWNVEFNFAQNFGGSNYSTTTGDLDGDGNTEIYMYVWDMFTMRIFECTGDQQYETVFEVDKLYGGAGIDFGGVDGVRVADVNGDGVNEMYIAGTEPQNQIFIVTGISDISQMTADDIQEMMKIPVEGNSLIGDGKFRSMYLADPDKDGNISMMIAGERNGQIFDVEYKGEGDPADSTSWDVQVIFDIWEESGLSPDSSGTLSPRFFYGHPAGDMDNDGKDEYIFVNYSADFSVWDGDSYVYMIEIDEATGVNNDAGLLPNSIELKQNYPNPFNPATNIEFALNKMSNVKLVVYDVLGRELETLVNRSMPAGIHSYTFDAANYASGIYYYSLFVGNGSSDIVQTKKMLLLR